MIDPRRTAPVSSSLSRSSKAWWRHWPIALAVAVVLLIVFLVWKHAGAKKEAPGKHGANQVQTIGVAAAAKADIPVSLSALGTVTPFATATVRTQINGIITEIGFSEGQMVKKGDFLAQIDPRPYQAQLAQYEGQLARDEALLLNARLDLTRYRTLIKQDSVAQQTVDTAAATVKQDEGTVKTDQALVEVQKINLAYCHITSPISGRIGLRQVDLGNYVTTGDTGGIVVVTQEQPISVVFTLPEDDLSQILPPFRKGEKLAVTAFDRSNSTKLAEGTLISVDNQIDTATGTVKFRATFDNRDRALFPNQFVNATLLVNTLHDAVTIPTSAIQQGQPGIYVYLFNDDHTVSVRKITPGPASGDKTSIAAGLNLGDKVVTDGADKLKDGAKVRLAGEDAPAGEGKEQGGEKAGPASADATQGEHKGHSKHADKE